LYKIIKVMSLVKSCVKSVNEWLLFNATHTLF
jgi:hypothetical protein